MDFTALSANGSDMAEFLGNTYDATYAIAHALHYLAERDIEITGQSLHQVLIDIVDFVGASGRIFVEKGTDTFGHYGRGNREVGNVFQVTNFNEEKYVIGDSNDDVMTPVMRWTLEDGAVVLGPCKYNTRANLPPKDRRDDILVDMSYIQKTVVKAVGILCVVWSALLYIFLIVFRNAKVVKAAQAKMSQLVVIGGMLAGGRVINASMDITDTSCSVGLWLGHLGFVLIFGTLLVKTWRVYRLLNAGLKKIKISEEYVLAIMGFMIGAFVFYLAIMTEVGEARRSTKCSLSHNRKTCLEVCSFEYTEFHTALFAIEACLLIYGAYLCYGTKGAPDVINESQFIALAMALIVVVAALVFPLVYLIDLKPADRQLIASVSIGIVAILSLASMFWPKVLAVIDGEAFESWSQITGNINKVAEYVQRSVSNSNTASTCNAKPVASCMTDKAENSTSDGGKKYRKIHPSSQNVVPEEDFKVLNDEEPI